MNKKVSSESFVKDIRRKTRKKYSSEEKIRRWKRSKICIQLISRNVRSRTRSLET
jgi:hypothetical protein